MQSKAKFRIDFVRSCLILSTLSYNTLLWVDVRAVEGARLERV